MRRHQQLRAAPLALAGNHAAPSPALQTFHRFEKAFYFYMLYILY
jgi:hypothetical protein